MYLLVVARWIEITPLNHLSADAVIQHRHGIPDVVISDNGSQYASTHLVLLAYHETPLENGYSPSKLLMGRKLAITLPTVESVYLS